MTKNFRIDDNLLGFLKTIRHVIPSIPYKCERCILGIVQKTKTSLRRKLEYSAADLNNPEENVMWYPVKPLQQQQQQKGHSSYPDKTIRYLKAVVLWGGDGCCLVAKSYPTLLWPHGL